MVQIPRKSSLSAVLLLSFPKSLQSKGFMHAYTRASDMTIIDIGWKNPLVLIDYFHSGRMDSSKENWKFPL